MQTLSSASRKPHQKRIILTSIAVGAAGVMGYFGWQLYKKKVRAKTSMANNYSDLDSLLPSTTRASAVNLSPVAIATPDSTSRPKVKVASASSSAAASASDSDFPLKKGSKGEKVKLLQKALIAKYGKSILPKYGADGGFGSETAAALKKAGLPASIDESTYNVLVQAGQVDGALIGEALYNATVNRDFSAVLTALKKMNSTSDYTAANTVFKNSRIEGVRQTIVNALLTTFSAVDQQQQIKFEFLRIGLQYNGSQWSLSGLGGLPIITIRPATVWTNARNRMNVPARVVLGNEVSRRLDYTLFENQGQYFLVPTRCVRYIAYQ